MEAAALSISEINNGGRQSHAVENVGANMELDAITAHTLRAVPMDSCLSARAFGTSNAREDKGSACALTKARTKIGPGILRKMRLKSGHKAWASSSEA